MITVKSLIEDALSTFSDLEIVGKFTSIASILSSIRVIGMQPFSNKVSDS